MNPKSQPPIDPNLAMVLFKGNELVALLEAARAIHDHPATRPELRETLADIIDNCESVLRRMARG